MAEAIGPVIEIVKLLIDPLWRQVDYFWNYKGHVAKLESDEKTLRDEMVKLEHAVNDEEREGKKIEGDVDRWVNKANEVIKTAETLLGTNENEGSEINKSTMMFCSAWGKRYQHGRKAKKLSEKVAELVKVKKEKFDSGAIAFNYPVQGTIEPFYFEEFQSRKSIFKEIISDLKSPAVTMIGVYGFNGVGKTTLVRAIASQAYKEQIVDEVAIATVFQERNMNGRSGEEAAKPDIKRIQDEITDHLKFKFQTKTVSATADELRTRLKDEKKKRLIILDDIWLGFKLEEVGIPDGHNGCKILMTSTAEHVLSGMGSKNFRLNLLKQEEALKWFKKKVGDVVRNHAIDRVADEIAEKCDGWPILLDSVANGLKYKENLEEWQNASAELSNYDKNDRHRLVDLGLRLSYNRLDDDTKKLFLLCGLFPPNNIFIKYLFRYSRGMGLFPRKHLADTRRSFFRSINHLKASSLLQEGFDEGILMMNNFVHSFVMSVQSENALIVISENDLPQWSEVDLEKYTAISLYCKISELPEEFKCPNLIFFLLWVDGYSFKFPEQFFRLMGKLKVLDFSGANFSPLLPPSFESLTDLQTLSLDYCGLFGVTNMGIIGRLKNLKILSFRGSDIVKLPIEIKQLSHLQLLDLSKCQELEEIPQTLFLGLKNLEDLHIQFIYLDWEVGGIKNKLTELASLRNLTTLDIQIADPTLLEKVTDLFPEKLEGFKILIGDSWDWSDVRNSLNTLKLELNKNVLYMEGVRVLMQKVEELFLQKLEVKKPSLDAYGFPRLKHLHLEMVRELAYINSLESGSSAAFPTLESLYLDNLKDLKKISHGKFIDKSFGYLRVLEVKNCPALNNLFSTYTANALSHLEELNISDCETLEEIAIEESENDSERVEEVNLPRLQKLTLQSLPKLTSFWSKQNKTELQNVGEAKPLFSDKLSCPNLKDLNLSSMAILEKIWQERVPETSSSSFRNLTSMILDGCNNLKYLLSFSAIEIVANLKSLRISNCKMMKEVIAMEGFQGQTMELQHLEKLSLQNLPQFAGFCNYNLLKFPALTTLRIQSCPELRRFISNSNAAGNEDDMKDFILFNEKVAFPNLKDLTIMEVDKLKLIWHSDLKERVTGTSSSYFQNLTSVRVSGCDDLEYLLSFSMLEIAVNLKSLEIYDCKMMKQVIAMEGFQEQTVELQHLEKLSLIKLQEFSGFCSCNLLKCSALTTLRIENCPELRRFISNSDVIGSEADITDSVLFNQKVVFPSLNDLTIEKVAKLKLIWHCGLKERLTATSSLSFQNLTSLSVGGCKNLEYLMSCSMLKTVVNLKILKISNCKMVKQVVMEESEEQTVELQHLKELELENLPKLRRFMTNSNAIDIKVDMTDSVLFNEKVGFPNLKKLFISGANELVKIFPSSYAQTWFQNLEIMAVWNCKSLEEVFGRQPTINTDAKTTIPLRRLVLQGLPKLRHIWSKETLDNEEEAEEIRFQFPQLYYLYLSDLPELKNFYSGRHSVECPALEYLDVDCDKVEIVKSEQGLLEIRSKPSSERQPTEGVIITAESSTSSVPPGQASEISTEDKSPALVVPDKQVPNNFQATDNSDYGPPSMRETGIGVTTDEQATSTQFEVTMPGFKTRDSQETSSLQEDTTKNGLVLNKENQKHPQELNQNEQPPHDVSDSFNQQASTIPKFPTAADFFARSTVGSSTISTSSKESNSMASMPNSETPFQLADSSFHAPADVEPLSATTGEQYQEFSFKPSSSSVSGTDFNNSSDAKSKNHVYSMDLIKKILKKNLTEVARSTDAHHLLINLINLKNSPSLNSHQVEAIQDYIDNFDSLLAYHHPSSEQQIEMVTSALLYSIEEKQRSIANLNALYKSSTIMSRTLGETKEALKKMLHETEAEEDRIRASSERVYDDLVAKKGELETDVSVLSKAKSHQKEVADKARKANDSWEKLKNLFT